MVLCPPEDHGWRVPGAERLAAVRPLLQALSYAVGAKPDAVMLSGARAVMLTVRGAEEGTAPEPSCQTPTRR